MGGQKWDVVCFEEPLGDLEGEKGREEGGGMNLGGDWSLTTGQRQLPVTVAWAMAGVLSGMLGADTLLLDSWLEQKGVDGFSLSVSSFHIQQIRVAGCCGDNTE